LPNEENSAFGQLKQGTLCLQSQQGSSEVTLVECNDSEPSQHSWAFNVHTGSIQQGQLCLTAHDKAKYPVLESCTLSHRQVSTSQSISFHAKTCLNKMSTDCISLSYSHEISYSWCSWHAVCVLCNDAVSCWDYI